MKTFYHATNYDNLISILKYGLKPGCEGVVYLAETPEDALKFVYLRGYKTILTLKVKIYKKDENKLQETFDHSYKFFKCRAFGYEGIIHPENIEPYMKYEL